MKTALPAVAAMPIKHKEEDHAVFAWSSWVMHLMCNEFRTGCSNVLF